MLIPLELAEAIFECALRDPQLTDEQRLEAA